MTVEQLADACVVLEELHQNFDDADWLWELSTFTSSSRPFATRTLGTVFAY